MAHFYCDSSALVKRYIAERGTTRITGLVAASGNTIYTSRISAAEISAAIFRRSRSGAITQADAHIAVVQIAAELGVHVQVIEVTAPIVTQAVALSERHFLRGYDAVQLATALAVQHVRQRLGSSPITFVSADDELNAAARVEGSTVENPNHYS